MSAIYDFAATMWRQMKDDFDAIVENEFQRAESEIGCLLSNEAQRLGISAWSLFIGSEARAYRFASEELVEHWETVPRPRLDDFEEQWLRGYTPA